MIVGAGLPSVSVHLMVTDIPTRVVMFVAGMMVREGCTGEGGGKEEGRKVREEAINGCGIDMYYTAYCGIL